MSEQITKLKVELFDMIVKQEQLMNEFNSINQLKLQKIQELQKLELENKNMK